MAFCKNCIELAESLLNTTKAGYALHERMQVAEDALVALVEAEAAHWRGMADGSMGMAPYLDALTAAKQLGAKIKRRRNDE